MGAAAFAIGSGVFQGISAYQSAAAEKTAAQYQAQVAANNARLAEWQAEDALHRGQEARAANRRTQSQLEGKQRATLAARGLDIGSGSALAILSDSEIIGSANDATIQNNANREAWGHRVQATNYKANADLLKYQADNIDPMLAGVTSLLGSASKANPKWSKGVYDNLWLS